MKIFITIFLVLFSYVPNISAQELTYHKKTNQIQLSGVPIVQIEKHKSDKERSYTVTSHESGLTLFTFTRHQLIDTLLTETQFYYEVESPSLSNSFFVDNFSEVNMQKAIAEQIIENQLINNKGDVDTDGLTKYQATNINYPEIFRQRNDSIMQEVMIGAEKVERNTRKPIEVNKFGKIGQDNTVIATWEMIEHQPRGFNASKEYCIQIKNLNGGLLAFSWIRVISNELYYFDDKGVRKKDIIRLNTPIVNSVISDANDRQHYIIGMTEILLRKGLL